MCREGKKNRLPLIHTSNVRRETCVPAGEQLWLCTEYPSECSICIVKGNRDLFIEDIYSILKENSVARKVKTEYGIKYIVKGKIGERFGKPVAVITIWLVEEEDMKESDTVVVNKDISDYGIERGDIGVVVHIYEDKSAVEVEFVSGEGTTLGVMTLRSEDVRLMKKDEILHVRELHTA